MSEVKEIVGLDEFNQKMRRLTERDNFKNPRIMFKKISIVLDQWVQKNFQQEGKPAMGTTWAALKQSTIDQRRKGRGSGGGRRIRILQDTGIGKASVKPQYNDRMAKVSTDNKYMGHHHKGEGNNPVRRIIPQYGQIRKRVRKVMETHVGKDVVRRIFGT